MTHASGTAVVEDRQTSACQYVFTSESVTEGHPDKVADYIADSVLDAHLTQDSGARVACEVLCKASHVIVAGEVTSSALVDVEQVVRRAIVEIGYTSSGEPFNADGVTVTSYFSQQAAEIAQGVGGNTRDVLAQGAGDQGIMFGYATDETPELMPLPILLAHRLSFALATARKTGEVSWLRPDGKTQVSVEYDSNREPQSVGTVLVSTQHSNSTTQEEVRAFLRDRLVPQALEDWFTPATKMIVNPTGSFVEGGPSADCGVTGRKIIVDSYGGASRHGGGAFSGKDPSKVDRSGAYFSRYVARQIVQEEIARRAEVNVAYAIGVARPVSVRVDTFGTGDERAAREFINDFDFRPGAIIERLDLLRPIYRTTTNYGHFGHAGFTWEQ
ncbi:MAG: methionine adenosyltransferase [Gemmatimonadaceae bacterium]